jgi:hypothetical protein
MREVRSILCFIKHISTPIVPLFFDPPESKCKGKRKKATRFKPATQKKNIYIKRRTCSICNAKEGHNVRTCPQVEFFIIFLIFFLF